MLVFICVFACDYVCVFVCVLLGLGRVLDDELLGGCVLCNVYRLLQRSVLFIHVRPCHHVSGAPAEIFPRGGKSFTKTFIHFTYQSMRRPTRLTLLCIVCIGSRSFRSSYLCMHIEKKHNIMKEDS